MARKKHTILIAGASGVVGAAAVEHFASLPDWEVIALSRSLPATLCAAPSTLSAPAKSPME